MKTRITTLILLCVFLSACDKVGSEGWCENLKSTPKSEWTLAETGDYTKYCVLGMDPEK